MNKDKEVLDTIKGRKMSYFGHIRDKKYETLQLIMQAIIINNTSQDCRQTSSRAEAYVLLENLRHWAGHNSVELFRSAVSGIIWARMIVNIHLKFCEKDMS